MRPGVRLWLRQPGRESDRRMGGGRPKLSSTLAGPGEGDHTVRPPIPDRGARCLVQDQNIGPAEQGACCGHPLLLARRQDGAPSCVIIQSINVGAQRQLPQHIDVALPIVFLRLGRIAQQRQQRAGWHVGMLWEEMDPRVDRRADSPRTVGAKRPASARKKVLFPLPDLPRRSIRSPAATSQMRHVKQRSAVWKGYMKGRPSQWASPS